MRTMLITGCSRGIGLALCEYFLNKFHIIATARSDNDLLMLNEMGVDAFYLDAANDDSLNNFLLTIKNKYKSLDVLVNNIGMANVEHIENIDCNDLNTLMKVNFYSSVFTISNLSGLLKLSNSGRVINISSVLSSMPQKGFSCYSSSKAALEAFTKSAALEFAEYGITVNAIAPGFVNTDMLNVIDERKLSRMKKNIPLKRFCEPNEVAYLVDFLSSKESQYITGEVININGGLHF